MKIKNLKLKRAMLNDKLSRVRKGNKIPKELREKGKSKFLGYRPELQNVVNYEISPSFRKMEEEKIRKNIVRRSKLKINQEKYPKKYYSDCFVNSKEYKNRHKDK